ncbi:class 1 fructose-bisphosphatase [Pelobacter seleniigenes]|uniref:class 1 fructose-bisphosphatase n=1 Tax=Pelobacter seleniigenes TaxID=407188 RepID=UPI0004A74442|nr:class 1 fructose-bisphosphatase [Pelobacter seleniigenes]
MVAEEIGTTLSQHIIKTQKNFPQASGRFTRIFNELATCGKIISSYVRRAGIIDIAGKRGTTNIQGEEQAKLDVIAHNIFVNRILETGLVAGVLSEESDDIIEAEEEYSRNANYIIATDPLDGSSNIDVNVSVGTVFSLLRRKSPTGERCSKDDFLQPGSKQIAAGYILYGSSTIFTYASGDGVFCFTLDPTVGEYLLSHSKLRIAEEGNIYSVNEGNRKFWDQGDQQLLDYFQGNHKDNDEPYTGRYIGSLVTDVHRNLLKGGIYLYPRTTKNGKKDHGKLRLLYEANPLAFIIEQAGGVATDGQRRILDIMPQDIHQRVPLYIGSKREVDLAGKFTKVS